MTKAKEILRNNLTEEEYQELSKSYLFEYIMLSMQQLFSEAWEVCEKHNRDYFGIGAPDKQAAIKNYFETELNEKG